MGIASLHPSYTGWGDRSRSYPHPHYWTV